MKVKEGVCNVIDMMAIVEGNELEFKKVLNIA
jgi:hypothetical protein